MIGSNVVGISSRLHGAVVRRGGGCSCASSIASPAHGIASLSPQNACCQSDTLASSQGFPPEAVKITTFYPTGGGAPTTPSGGRVINLWPGGTAARGRARGTWALPVPNPDMVIHIHIFDCFFSIKFDGSGRYECPDARGVLDWVATDPTQLPPIPPQGGTTPRGRRRPTAITDPGASPIPDPSPDPDPSPRPGVTPYPTIDWGAYYRMLEESGVCPGPLCVPPFFPFPPYPFP